MKKILLTLLAAPYLAFAAEPSIQSLLLPKDDHLRIVVNNRVLSKINGKPITVIDVMKRMDILFLKQFPEYTNSVQARYQFYTANWRYALDDLIQKELILADAKESKMEVASGDVRQEMEQIFGPNIIVNLDKIGLSLDEAFKIVSGDIAIRRMMYVKVTSKALGHITPEKLRVRYEEYAKEKKTDPSYTYRLITVREENEEKGKLIAGEIYNAIKNDTISPETFLKNHPEYAKIISLSKDVTQTEKEIAPQNKEILLSLKENEISLPQAQKSRAQNSMVYRIFLMTKTDPGSVPSYLEAQDEIKQELIGEAIEKESEVYLAKLKRHYGVSETHFKEMVPEKFTPFSLQ